MSWDVNTADSSTLQNRAIFRLGSCLRGSLLLATMMSGCTPILRSSWTLCWVGLVFCSPTLGEVGGQLQDMVEIRCRRQFHLFLPTLSRLPLPGESCGVYP